MMTIMIDDDGGEVMIYVHMIITMLRMTRKRMKKEEKRMMKKKDLPPCEIAWQAASLQILSRALNTQKGNHGKLHSSAPPPSPTLWCYTH